MDQVSIPDQEAFRSLIEIPYDLTHPRSSRLPRHSHDLHPPTRQIDKEEHDKSRRALGCPSLDCEDTRRHDQIPVSPQKLRPRGLAVPFRSRSRPYCLRMWRSCHARPYGSGWRALPEFSCTRFPVLRGHADHQPPESHFWCVDARGLAACCHHFSLR